MTSLAEALTELWAFGFVGVVGDTPGFRSTAARVARERSDFFELDRRRAPSGKNKKEAAAWRFVGGPDPAEG